MLALLSSKDLSLAPPVVVIDCWSPVACIPKKLLAFFAVGAPTAKNANNFFGMHATGDQQSMTTTGGAKLRSFDDSKASIRAFLQLMANDERYKNVVESMDTVENMFQSMGDSPYAKNPNYTNLLGNVYKNRIQPILQTENFLMPKRKPILEQMDSLK